MIGLGLILLGCLSLYLGFNKLKDRRKSRNEFSATATSGLHPIWKKVSKLQRFNAHLDIWIFLVLGPVVIIVGVVALLRGE